MSSPATPPAEPPAATPPAATPPAATPPADPPVATPPAAPPGQTGLAAMGVGDPPPGTPPAAAPAPAWTEGMTPERIGLVEARGWKSPDELLTSYENLEKLKGAPAEDFVRLPGLDADDATKQEFYTKLGRPEKAEEYQLGSLELAEGSIDLRGEFADWSHKAGLNKEQALNLATTYNEYMVGVMEEMEAQVDLESKADVADLKREWGQAYDHKRQEAITAAHQFGVSDDMMSALDRAWGTRSMMTFFANLGEKIGELPGPGGGREDDGDPFTMTPERARFELAEMDKDPKIRTAYLSGDKDLVAKRTRLTQIAYPEPPPVA